ncbi:MAG: hypothetical protein DRI73_06955 [Bacteroidetes bacterium]|nr:MAG: hypothetical protein DRI73_06955 [Bacteroidota bacterium]
MTKLLAFLFPLCAMYGLFVPEKSKPESMAYWRYIIAGLVFYLILLTVSLSISGSAEKHIIS